MDTKIINITKECPNCQNNMNYIKDKHIELLGYYAFGCNNCNEKTMMPKNNPLLRKT